MQLPEAPVDWNALGRDGFPGLLGIEVLAIERGRSHLRMPVQKKLHAANGYLHAGSVVTLADTACGYGCRASLPDGAKSFTTLDLQSNFIATALEGTLECDARGLHLGRRTQVWEATVRHGDKIVAVFRCTQLILWPGS
jgi:1,4-dihydroxy-2-naphthoyl-CoA hydrolase